MLLYIRVKHKQYSVCKRDLIQIELMMRINLLSIFYDFHGIFYRLDFHNHKITFEQLPSNAENECTGIGLKMN